MKTLLLLRHGKSSWKDCGLADHERPLKKRGRQAAVRMGQLLRERGLLPERILSSPAVRAVETTQHVVRAAKLECAVETVPALYHADPRTFVAVVSRVPNQFQRVLIVGHNPGLEEWLARLTRRTEMLPTAALAKVDLPIETWLDLSLETQGILDGLWRPKEL